MRAQNQVKPTACKGKESLPPALHLAVVERPDGKRRNGRRWNSTENRRRSREKKKRRVENRRGLFFLSGPLRKKKKEKKGCAGRAHGSITQTPRADVKCPLFCLKKRKKAHSFSFARRRAPCSVAAAVYDAASYGNRRTLLHYSGPTRKKKRKKKKKKGRAGQLFHYN